VVASNSRCSQQRGGGGGGGQQEDRNNAAKDSKDECKRMLVDSTIVTILKAPVVLLTIGTHVELS
jgi:hypothetical protein